MKASFACQFAAVALGLFASFAIAGDDEEKVPLDKLPKPVAEAVTAKFPKAELVSAEKETEDGKTIYEVAIKNKDQKIEVSVTAEGKIIEIEAEITVKDLPKPVSAALDKGYPKATVKKVEQIEKDGELSYELLLVTADKKTVEVKFDPKGKVLAEEKKDKDEK